MVPPPPAPSVVPKDEDEIIDESEDFLKSLSDRLATCINQCEVDELLLRLQDLGSVVWAAYLDDRYDILKSAFNSSSFNRSEASKFYYELLDVLCDDGKSISSRQSILENLILNVDNLLQIIVEESTGKNILQELYDKGQFKLANKLWSIEGVVTDKDNYICSALNAIYNVNKAAGSSYTDVRHVTTILKALIAQQPENVVKQVFEGGSDFSVDYNFAAIYNLSMFCTKNKNKNKDIDVKSLFRVFDKSIELFEYCYEEYIRSFARKRISIKLLWILL